MKRERQLAVASRHGWDVDDESIKCVKVANVVYYLMEHGWSCNRCAARVTVAEFTRHARRHR